MHDCKQRPSRPSSHMGRGQTRGSSLKRGEIPWHWQCSSRVDKAWQGKNGEGPYCTVEKSRRTNNGPKNRWNHSTHPFPKKKKIYRKQCQNYRTISLLVHSNKARLKVIQNHLRLMAEELSEEQAGFRAGKSTAEQTVNSCILTENMAKRSIIMSSISDGFWWFFGFWSGMRSLGTWWNSTLTRVLFKPSKHWTRAGWAQYLTVRWEISFQQWVFIKATLCHTAVQNIPVRHGSLFNQNPVLLTMRTLWTDWQTVQMHKGWTDKSKIMVNTTMSGVQLEEVHSFKYVGTTFSEDGSCTADIHIRISMATAAVGKLNSWDSKNIRFIFKYRLHKFPIIPYAVQLWDVNLVCQDGQRIHAFETKLLRRLLHITYKDCSSNDFLWCTVTTLVGPQENLLITVKWRKLVWFDHDIRHKNLWQQVPLNHPHRWAS